MATEKNGNEVTEAGSPKSPVPQASPKASEYRGRAVTGEFSSAASLASRQARAKWGSGSGTRLLTSRVTLPLEH